MNEAALKSYFMLLLACWENKVFVNSWPEMATYLLPFPPSYRFFYFLRPFMCSKLAWIDRSLSQTEMFQHLANNSVASVR